MKSTGNITQFPDLSESNLITNALRFLETRLRQGTQLLNNSRDVCAFLQLHLAFEASEVFAVLFLDSQHRLLAFEKIFQGTINQSTVYPRVVVQRALNHNAAAVLLVHNHPSGHCQPSKADQDITRELRAVLNILDISVLDHIVVSYPESFSFAEQGLI